MRWCSYAYKAKLVLLDSIFGAATTYKRESAVSAGADLWLIEIDEDPGMSQWSTATVAHDSSLVDPANGLLVDELNGCFGRRLYVLPLAFDFRNPSSRPFPGR